MTTDKRKRVVFYARVSTTGQKPDLQLDGLRALAAQRGWQVVGEFTDIGWSGRKARRPQLDAMMKVVGRGGADVVAVWKLDRLGRSTKELLNLLDIFRTSNVQVVSVQETLDTETSIGRAFYTIIAMLGELEAAWTGERTKASLAAAAARGVRIGRPPVQFDAARAEALLVAGKSLRQVAATLGIGLGTVARWKATRSGAVPQPHQPSVAQAPESAAAA